MAGPGGRTAAGLDPCAGCLVALNLFWPEGPGARPKLGTLSQLRTLPRLYVACPLRPASGRAKLAP